MPATKPVTKPKITKIYRGEVTVTGLEPRTT